MTTYDVHTHIGIDQGFYFRRWWPYCATTQDLLQHMDRNGIDKAAVFPFGLPSAFDPYAYADAKTVTLQPNRFPFDRENDLLINEVKQIDTANRLHVLAMFDPSREIDQQLASLERIKDDITGLKVQATILESPIPALLEHGRPLMEFAEANQMPVLIHTSFAPADQFSQISDCIAVARAYPKARFNLAHSLRFDEPSLREVKDIPNVWVDCSAHLAHCHGVTNNEGFVATPDRRVDADYNRPAEVLEAIHGILGDRYMWGSDNPFMSWCDDKINAVFSYDKEVNVLKDLPANVRDDMLSVGPTAWLLG